MERGSSSTSVGSLGREQSASEQETGSHLTLKVSLHFLLSNIFGLKLEPSTHDKNRGSEEHSQPPVFSLDCIFSMINKKAQIGNPFIPS